MTYKGFLQPPEESPLRVATPNTSPSADRLAVPPPVQPCLLLTEFDIESHIGELTAILLAQCLRKGIEVPPLVRVTQDKKLDSAAPVGVAITKGIYLRTSSGFPMGWLVA